MPSPFPGVDPFLEGPLWPSFHAQLCSELARRLTPILGPRYIALVEERLVVDSLDNIAIATRALRPDVTIAGERSSASGSAAGLEPPLRLPTVMEAEVPVHFVEVREVASLTVVTVIEVLSPSNKAGEGRLEYLRKRRAVLNSDVNLVEIDLLRGGERVPMRAELPATPYFALIHRTAMRPMADVWPIGLKEQLPVIPVPLLPPDADAKLDLQAAYAGAMDSVDYSRVIDYDRALEPPLEPTAEARWVQETLARRLRTP